AGPTRPILISHRIRQKTTSGVLACLVLLESAWSKSPLTTLPREQPPRQTQNFIAHWAKHRSRRWNRFQGGGWTTYDGGTGSTFHLPVGVCTDRTGRIYVSEQYHHHIFRFDDMLGGGLAVHSPSQSASQPVNRFAGSWICVDSIGRIYVTY